MKRILDDMVARADVVIENFSAGVATRLGIDYPALLQVMGRSDLKDDANMMQISWRLMNNDAVDRVVAEWVTHRTRDEIVAALAQAGVPGQVQPHPCGLRCAGAGSGCAHRRSARTFREPVRVRTPAAAQGWHHMRPARNQGT
jgi:crotonobetainyl-CoA:carnitine CoA-transferase CaiB-like acyl-CoA transferase